MSVSALIFSKDRAAQLDLLLRSLEQNAPDLCDDVSVLWTASDEEYERGYALLFSDHPTTDYVRESNFESETRELLGMGRVNFMFLTDDSVFYRPLDGRDPTHALDNSELLCFSLRLGLHCGICYPHDRAQGLPEFRITRVFTDTDGINLEGYTDCQASYLTWPWQTGDADWGYGGSLDGHLFRRDQLRTLIGSAPFANPNTLEDVLVRSCALAPQPLMACYEQSHLVGIPANRVNTTHGNRFGQWHPYGTRELNDRFLLGERLSLERMRFGQVTGAHTELKLVFA